MLLVAIARGLAAAFVVIVLSSLFPLQLFDTGWQQQLIRNLLNNAPLPLTAMALLVLDLRTVRPVYLLHSESPAPEESGPQLSVQQLRLQRAQWLCRAAAIGFALLCLAQIVVSSRILNQSASEIAQRNRVLSDQLSGAAGALEAAGQPEQFDRLAALLLPRNEQAQFKALPIQQQRNRLEARIGQTETAARRELIRVRTNRFTLIIVDGLRNIALALIFAAVFWRLRPVPALLVPPESLP